MMKGMRIRRKSHTLKLGGARQIFVTHIVYFNIFPAIFFAATHAVESTVPLWY